MKPTLLILAAGIGSRFGGLKQAEGVGPSGEAILDYSIADAINAGFGKITFVIRRDILDDMSRIFFDKWARKIEIDYVFQQPDDLPGGFIPPAGRSKPWGTGHAIWVAREAVREPFCMINADDFYGRNSFMQAAAFLSDMANLIEGRYALIGYELKNTLSEHGFVSRAECEISHDGLLTGITERLQIKREGYTVFYIDAAGKPVEISENATVSMNMWGFMPSLFGHLEEDLLQFLSSSSLSLKAEFLLPNVIDRLIKSSRVEIPVIRTDSKWFGMTYSEDRDMVRHKLKELVDTKVYSTPIWNSF